MRDYRERTQTPAVTEDDPSTATDGEMTIEELVAQLPPEEQALWARMSPEQQQQALQQMQGMTN